jgi:diguanylate cyclase (GGDEF)-like protein
MANAFLICVGALLLVIGVNYARVEINGLVHDQASVTAQTWASQVVRNAPELPELLASPKADTPTRRSLGNNTPTGQIVSYSIYDLNGDLRVWVAAENQQKTSTEAEFKTQVTLPLVKGGKKIGTIMADINSAASHHMLTQGAAKIGAILSSAIGFILLVSLLVRANARQETQRNIKRMMQNDSTTGLPNQLAFLEMLSTFHNQELEQNGTTNIFLINVDRFSRINERLGNSNGDGLLRAVAERLLIAGGDKVVTARLGSDTFGILCDNDIAKNLDRSLERCFSQPFEVEGEAIRLSVSIGVASSTDGMYSVDELQSNAEFALRAAKANGGHSLVKYDSDTVTEFREVERIAGAVEEACQRNSFELHYQPVVDAQTRKLCSFEALIRLTSSSGEKIGPDKFIPIAESIGRIDEIGLWTIREACRTMAGLPAHIGMAVNLSVQQFASDTLVDDIANIIKETRVDANRLELEVTEGIMIGDAEAVFKQLSKLQKKGIKIALDDFGTGYSSLNYLWRFTFDKLKIDQAFIRASDTHPKALALLQKIAEVGRTLNMKITAEGIETEAHATRVADLGCHYSQGYLFGKPIPQTALAAVVISEFADYINEQTGGQARVDDKVATAS